jgi:tellurite resistance protein TehA-like permease
MGATAIIVLAGARILGLPAAPAVVKATAGFVEGFSFALWAFGTWWIPLLVVLGIWRHVRHRWPLTYEPAVWSVVFPLGMYSVATAAFGQAAHLAFMGPLTATGGITTIRPRGQSRDGEYRVGRLVQQPDWD